MDIIIIWKFVVVDLDGLESKSVFLLGPILTTWRERKVQKGFFLGENGPKSSHKEERKSKVAIFRE
jgi:hypothetical protein